MTYEAAFHEPWPNDSDFLMTISSEMRSAKDSYTKGKFIEILGIFGSAAAIPIINDELADPDQNIRTWAITALKSIGGKESESVVRLHCLHHPDDDVQPSSH